MLREERCCYAGKHETRQNSDRQYVLLDLLPPLRFCRAKDDALDLIVYPPAYLEGIRVWVTREVVEVGLKQPERLLLLAVPPTPILKVAHQQSAIDRLLA